MELLQRFFLKFKNISREITSYPGTPSRRPQCNANTQQNRLLYLINDIPSDFHQLNFLPSLGFDRITLDRLKVLIHSASQINFWQGFYIFIRFKSFINEVMNRKQNTLIYYHVPEDYDLPEQPNVFLVPLPKNKLQLQHIYQHFPLKGTYAFRFKISFDELVVWLDLSDPQATIPVFKEQIHLKASRLSWQDLKNPQTNINQSRNLGKSSHSKDSIDILEPHPQSLSQKKEGNPIHLGDVSLLDGSSPGNSPALHPVLSEPAFKIDFFGEEKPPEKQGFHAQPTKDYNHGDLI